MKEFKAFAVPPSRFGDLVEGLEGTHKGGIRYPTPKFFRYTGIDPDHYMPMEELWAKEREKKGWGTTIEFPALATSIWCEGSFIRARRFSTACSYPQPGGLPMPSNCSEINSPMEGRSASVPLPYLLANIKDKLRPAKRSGWFIGVGASFGRNCNSRRTSLG